MESRAEAPHVKGTSRSAAQPIEDYDMTDKRPRGRPKGTGIKDDRHLDAVANLIVRQPGLKKTPAISQIVQKTFPEHQWNAAERRLLRKWDRSAEERIEAAQKRYEEEKRERRAVRSFSASDLLSQLTGVNSYAAEMARMNSFAREMQEMLNPSLMQELREQASMMQQIRDMVDPPLLREMREQAEMINKMLRGF